MPGTSPGRFSLGSLSIRTKSFLFVGVMILMMTGSYLVLVSSLLSNSLSGLQNDLTTRQIDAVVRQIDQVARQQRQSTFDNAVWNETFDFLKGKEQGYLERNFDPKTGNSGKNLVILFDRQKNPFAWISIPGFTRLEKDLPPYFDPDHARYSNLLQDGKSGSAIVATPEGLLILSAHPVFRTDGSGPSAGWLVYGLDLGAAWFEEMRQLTGVSISPSFPPRQMTDMSMQQGETLNTDTLGQCRVFLSQVDLANQKAPAVSAAIQFDDMIGSSAAALKLSIPSTVTATALDLRRQLVWSSILGGISLTIICLLAIEWIFIRKITQMDREFQKLSQSVDTAARLPETSRDEFSRLAKSANRLLDSLRQRRQESQNQEKLLSSVLDSASEGIMAFRSLRNEKGAVCDFIMVLANKAAENMVNRNFSDMMGKGLLGLFPGNLSEGLFERYVRAVETAIPEDFEIFYDHEDMRSWFHISAQKWEDGFVVTFEEISARKRAEQELKASIEELERFNRAMIGREDRVLEMKSEVNHLRSRLGLQPEYQVDSLNHES